MYNWIAIYRPSNTFENLSSTISSDFPSTSTFSVVDTVGTYLCNDASMSIISSRCCSDFNSIPRGTYITISIIIETKQAMLTHNFRLLRHLSVVLVSNVPLYSFTKFFEVWTVFHKNMDVQMYVIINYLLLVIRRWQ